MSVLTGYICIQWNPYNVDTIETLTEESNEQRTLEGSELCRSIYRNEYKYSYILHFTLVSIVTGG